MAVKDTLLGTEDSMELSAKNKAQFISIAAKDPESGELYLGEEEFINAIAPADEDYVSTETCLIHRLATTDMYIFSPHRARSNVSSTGSSFTSPIAKAPARSVSLTGPHSTTS